MRLQLQLPSWSSSLQLNTESLRETYSISILLRGARIISILHATTTPPSPATAQSITCVRVEPQPLLRLSRCTVRACGGVCASLRVCAALSSALCAELLARLAASANGAQNKKRTKTNQSLRK